ncbi:MAG TPA: hypothetical protein VFD23_06745 [Clostridia bacterium]|nr:hypothetical protein [Clostridia bacterium]
MLIKKLACLVIAACLALLPCACTKNDTHALDIAGAKISQEVYACFMDSVLLNPENFGLPTKPEKTAVKAKTEALCKDYVAVNTIIKDLGIPLDDNEKTAVATTVINLWHLFSTHYESIGVTKQTLTKIETSKAAKDTLLLYYYGADGTEPVGEDETKSYFSENYISFRTINGYLTRTNENGVTEELTPEEAVAMKSKLQSLAVRIADGEDFEQVSELFAEEQGILPGSTDFKLLGKDDKSYPEGFFDRVAALAPGQPGIIAMDNYIFLAVTREILLSEEDYFNSRKECLKALRGTKLDQMIAAATAEYEAASNERVTDKIYAKIVAQNQG